MHLKDPGKQQTKLNVIGEIIKIKEEIKSKQKRIHT